LQYSNHLGLFSEDIDFETKENHDSKAGKKVSKALDIKGDVTEEDLTSISSALLKFEKEQINQKHNGVLYLKGGDLAEELAGIKCEIHQLKNYFEEEFFDTKKVVYLSKGNFNS